MEEWSEKCNAACIEDREREPETEECQYLLGTGKSTETFTLRTSGKECSSADTFTCAQQVQCLTSNQQNCKLTDFCCFKPLNCW